MSTRRAGVIITVRFTTAEVLALRHHATREGDTVSATIREALYLQYGIGAFGVASLCCPPATR